MAPPTLACNAAATILRVPDGISGDPVTGNDIWDWDDGGGSVNGDGDVPKDGGGTVKVNTFIDETVEDGAYIIKAGKTLQMGNSVTASYFKMTSESWRGEAGAIITVTSNAVWVVDVSLINLAPGATYDIIASGQTGTFIMSKGAGLKVRSNYAVHFNSGTVDFSNCSLTHNGTADPCYFYFQSTLISQKYNDVLFESNRGVRFYATPDEMSNVRINNTHYGARCHNNITLTDISVTNYDVCDFYVAAGKTAIIKNPKAPVKAPLCADATANIKQQYNCDIRVSDPDGAGLVGVTVLCEDEADSEVFSVDTTEGLQVTGPLSPNVTDDFVNIGEQSSAGTYDSTEPDADVWHCNINGQDWYIWHDSDGTEYWILSTVVGTDGTYYWRAAYAAGDPTGSYTAQGSASGTATVAAISGLIPQQTIDYKKWLGTSETLTDYSPHKFTFSIAAYPDMAWEGIIVDNAIDWEVGMGGMSNAFRLEDLHYRLEDG